MSCTAINHTGFPSTYSPYHASAPYRGFNHETKYLQLRASISIRIPPCNPGNTIFCRKTSTIYTPLTYSRAQKHRGSSALWSILSWFVSLHAATRSRSFIEKSIEKRKKAFFASGVLRDVARTENIPPRNAWQNGGDEGGSFVQRFFPEGNTYVYFIPRSSNDRVQSPAGSILCPFLVSLRCFPASSALAIQIASSGCFFLYSIIIIIVAFVIYQRL